jgi:M6 family metalloprotease-like protein
MNVMAAPLWKPVLFLMCVSAALPCYAQTQEQRPEPRSAPLVQQFTRKHGPGWTVRLSADKKRISSVVGMGTRSYGEKPEPAARAFLTENAQMFGLRQDLGDMRVLSQHSSSAGGHVEFQQVVNGLPVENARVQVNLSKDGRVLQVVNNYAPFESQAAAPALSKQQAIDAAIAEFLRTTREKPLPKGGKPSTPFTPLPRNQMQLKEPAKVDDVYYAYQGQLVRAYKVLLDATRPFGMKEFIIASATGQILRTRNLIQDSVDGAGRVFIPDPITATGDGTLRGNNNSATAVPNNAYSNVTLFALDDASGGVFRLSGAFAKSEDIESPSTALVTETSSTFNYDRSQDGFEEVMAYFHIDRTQRYIQSLGFVDVNNRQIRFDAHGFSGADNSHYKPDTVGAGYLAFGDGGSNDAEDAEVIVHEYGHAIQDNQTLGKYTHDGEAGAMGEGFGDYWAVSNYNAERVAGGRDPACVMEWDTRNSTSGDQCLRRVDTTKKYPGSVDGEVHDDGEIWSAALWDAFNLIGKTTTDRVVLQSHFNVPDNPTFKQGADAMITADLQIFFGAHITQLCKVFKDRGIYADGDCPTLPPSSGTQSTLIVIASFSETGLPAVTLAQANTIANDMTSYLSEVSIGKATLGTPTFRTVTLANNRAHYYDETTRNMLVEMVQEVINLIHASEPAFDFTAVDRLFIITNDDGSGGVTGGQKEWATTGPWPYTIPTGAGTKRFSASIHTFNQTKGQFDHALGHHFGMFDLFAHDGVVFPRPYADGWSNMAKDPSGNFNNVHFFAWDKMKPAWLSGANITFIPRPPADPDPNHRFENTFPIFREETASGNPVVFQIATTPGATQLNERSLYYVEARKKTAGTFDSNLPSDAVLVYYVNEDIGQGFGPLRLIDATPGTSNDLTDAGLLPAPGNSTETNIDSTALNVEVLPPTGTEDYRVHITYDPPETQNDVWIHGHDDNWKSPDIWIDSPACNAGNCGFDTDNSRSEIDRGDKPQPNVVNRIYARIFNHGPATAHNVQVDFYISEPWHGLDGGDVDPDTGGNVAFNHHFVKFVGDVAPTDTGIPIFVEWTPTTPPSGQVHTCIKVKIATVFNDTNPANQVSQENIDEYDLTSHSPYPPVQDDFKVVNPYDHPILVYLRADDVPAGWTADIVPKKAYLPVGGSVTASMTIQAPLTCPICSTEYVKASGWYAAGDTLVPLGATVAQVNLKKSTDLTVNTSYQNCKQTPRLASSVSTEATTTGDNCQALRTQGCTAPPRPFEHITLTYTGPDGKPIYHDVVTDKNGCFEDFLVNPQGGPWHVDTQYQGSVCTAPVSGQPQTVEVPPSGGGGTIPPGVRARLWYSFDLGMNFPVGSFRKNFDPGPSITGDLEYQLNEKISLEAMYGFHFFHNHGAAAATGLPAGSNLFYRNLSFNARAYVPFSWARLYLQAGPGVYFPNIGSTMSGVDAGVGLNFPLLTNLKAEVGTDLHYVDPSGTRRLFVDYKLGLAFRF